MNMDKPSLPAMPDPADILLEGEIQRLGRTLHQKLRGAKPGLFDAAYWQGLVMDWAMSDPAIKTDLFRLVDALPALKTSSQVARHAREYLLAGDRQLPTGLGLALRATENPMAAGISAFIIRQKSRHFRT